MKKIFSNNKDKGFSIVKTFKNSFTIILCTLLLVCVSFNMQAQCPAAPASNAAAIVSNATVGAITMSTPSEVRYVTGNVVLGTSANAHSLTIGLNTTVVVTTGSHLTVTNVSVSGKLIIQAGATVSVVGLTGANGSLGVNAGGIIEMCENTGLENCGTTTFTPNPSVNYTGAAGGKAVIKTINKSGQVGSLVMPSFAPGLTASSNITVATPVVNISFPTPGGSYGSAVACNIGSNCGTLPFDVNGSCGSFATPAATCTAGTTAPAMAVTTKANACPTATIDLTTLTASNLPAGNTLTWHTGTPATTANKVAGTAVTAGTYYAAFFDATNNCYGGSTSGSATTAVTATSTACVSPGGAVANVCPATTINLTLHTQGTVPAGTTVTWHTGTPATAANKVAAPTTAAAGTYYAAFEDAANSCYSPTMGPVTATSTTCTPPPVVGVCTNILTNPSFESPVQTNVNGNNIVTGTTFNGWTASANTQANPFNIIKVNGTTYSAGPDKADDGNQYMDVVGSATITQDFTIPAGGAYIKYSGSYANRDAATAPTFYKPSYNYITILNSSGVVVGTSNAIDLISSLTDEKWLRVSGFTGTKLPAGTYTYKVVIGDYTHFDNAFVCLQANPPGGTIDCSKTQISTAPVAGNAGQKTLSVTIDVTTAGCLSPLFVSGSGMSLPDGVNQICTGSTGVQTFNIPVNYDGTALGTMNFTIGAAGSCSADLTKTPKKAISDVWTLDCVPTVGPSLK